MLAAVGAGTTVASVGTPVALDTPEPAVGVFTELLPGEPDPSSFPRRAWAASVRKVMQLSPDSLFTYGDRRGLTELRVALAGYLARSRSVVVDPARVVIFGGFASALATLSATFAALGIARVAVEDPGLPPYVRVIGAGGVEIVPVPVDDDGICIDDLRDARAVLCTPAHQFPMGVVLSATRRARLIQWARQHDAWVVEDDYDGEFRYDRRPIGAMQGLDPIGSSTAAPPASRWRRASASPGSCCRPRSSSLCSIPSACGATPSRRSNKRLLPSSSHPGALIATSVHSDCNTGGGGTRSCGCWPVGRTY